MYILLAGLTIGTLGKVLLGVTVIAVHWRIFKEHKIDKQVLKELKRERMFGLIGIGLIILGYFFELYFYTYSPLIG